MRMMLKRVYKDSFILEEVARDIYSRLSSIAPTSVLTQKQIIVLLKDQWYNAYLQSRNLREIDVGGLGTWKIAAKRAYKRYMTLSNTKDILDPIKQSKRIANIEHKLSSYRTIKDYEFLKGYLEREGIYIGGDKESDLSKEGDRGSSTEEVTNM